HYTGSFRPTISTLCQVETTPNVDYTQGTSNSDDCVISVRPVISVHLSHSHVRHGSSITFSGTLSPHRASALLLQRETHGVWHTVATTHSSSTGSYAFHVRTSSRGSWPYRVERAGDHVLVTGVSASVHLTVS